MKALILLGFSLFLCCSCSTAIESYLSHGNPQGHGIDSDESCGSWRTNSLEEAWKWVFSICPECNPNDFCPLGSEKHLPGDVIRTAREFDGSKAAVEEVLSVMRRLKKSDYHCFFLLMFGGPVEGVYRFMMVTILTIQKHAELWLNRTTNDNEVRMLGSMLGYGRTYDYVMTRQMLLEMFEDVSLVFGLRRDSERPSAS